MYADTPTVNAQIDIPSPVISGTPDVDVTSSVEQAFNTIGNIMTIIAVGVLVLTLIWGAIRFMTAGGDPENAGQARSIIMNGLIGAVILFALGYILGFVGSLVDSILS